MSLPLQVILCCASLLILASVARLVTRLLRRDPATSYRMLILILLITLTLPLMQWLLAGEGPRLSEPSWLHGFRQQLAKVANRSAIPQALDPGQVGSGAAQQTPALPSEWRLLSTLTPPQARTPDRMEVASLPAEDESELGWALIYGVGGVLVLLHYLRRLLKTLRLLSRSKRVTDPRILRAWHKVAASSPWFRATQLRHSERLDAPACWGFFKPVILLPVEVASVPPAYLQGALMHELIHLERRDAWVGSLQMMLTVAFWFHPAAWWLSRQLDPLREFSCDHEVVRRLGQRRDYAATLVQFARRSSAPQTVVDFPCPSLIRASRHGTLLKRRIEMLIASRAPASKKCRTWTWGFMGFCALALGGGQLALAAPQWSPGTDEPVARAGLVPAAATDPLPGFTDRSLVKVNKGKASDQQKKKGREKVGIQVERASAALAAQVGLTDENLLLVVSVEEGSFGAQLGLKKYDVITHINGKRGASVEDLREARGDDSVQLTVCRGGKTQVLSSAPAVDPELLNSQGRQALMEVAKHYYQRPVELIVQDYRQIAEQVAKNSNVHLGKFLTDLLAKDDAELRQYIEQIKELLAQENTQPSLIQTSRYLQQGAYQKLLETYQGLPTLKYSPGIYGVTLDPDEGQDIYRYVDKDSLQYLEQYPTLYYNYLKGLNGLRLPSGHEEDEEQDDRPVRQSL